MLSSSDLVGFVATADVEESLAFYRDTLGLALVDSSSTRTGPSYGSRRWRR